MVYQVNDTLVDQSAEDHFHDIHGLTVSDTHAIDECGFFTYLLEQFTDLRTAAMNDYGINADLFQ